MVAVSKFLTAGLSAPLQFNEVAYDVLSNQNTYVLPRHLFGAGPYFEYPGFGISPELPENCTYEQAHIFMRHGERYPGGSGYKSTVDKIQNYTSLAGPLSFLNDYQYYVRDSSDFEMLTTPENSHSPFLGSATAMKAGMAFRAKYGELYDENQTLPVFAASQYRCWETAQYFAKGFLGTGESNVEFVVVPEDLDSGFNTLTPTLACPNFNTSYNSEYISAFPTTYFDIVRQRLTVDNPGLSLTNKNIADLIAQCAYEFSNTGSSKFCTLFTENELITYDYTNSLSKYYTQGPGNPLADTLGFVHLNATLALLQLQDQKLVMSFTHDSDLAHLLNPLGFFNTNKPMPNDRVVFQDAYKYSDFITMGGRLVTEKFSYNNQSYVRFLVNNAVFPVKSCDTGPGFSCKLDDLVGLFSEKYADFNLTESCGANSSYPQQLTFYWDWQDNERYAVVPTVTV